jgi:hypothetical protein
MTFYKTEESFLEKLSMGAIGAQKIFSFLEINGHCPIELERGSLSFKIWKKIKIKRIRVPDILCVKSGICVESRAKSKIELSMSHSISDPNRGWDYGLKDSDFVAIVVCNKSGSSPIDWTAEDDLKFISIKDLRVQFKQDNFIKINPKGAQEGFESRIKWPIKTACNDGVIVEINEKIKYKTITGKTIVNTLNEKEIKLFPMVNVGDMVKKNQVLSSVVQIYANLPDNTVNSEYYMDLLSSNNLSDRYTSAKALVLFGDDRTANSLINKLNDTQEEFYIKLEAASSLAHLKYPEGYDFIEKILKDDYLANVLEAIIILADIKSEISFKMLCSVLLDERNNSDIRAGAAWALGELKSEIVLPILIKCFNYIQLNIKTEAARALGKLTDIFTRQITSNISKANNDELPGIAWALTHSENLTLDDLLKNITSIDSKIWISYVIGTQGENKYINEIEKLKNIDKEIYFAVTMLWQIMSNWVYGLKDY